jgi:hypothetical protein
MERHLAVSIIGARLFLKAICLITQAMSAFGQ